MMLFCEPVQLLITTSLITEKIVSQFKAEYYIKRLNDPLRVVSYEGQETLGGEVVEDSECEYLLVRKEEEEGQVEIEVTNPLQLEWAAQVDVVFVGPCTADKTGESPSKMVKWLQNSLEFYDGVKHAVVFQACCWSYSDEVKRAIRGQLMNITWHFPKVHDLCDCGDPLAEAGDLLRAGLLKVVSR